MIKFSMKNNPFLISGSSICFSQRWIAFKTKISWNPFFRLFRIMLFTAVCFIFIWLLLNFINIILPKLHKLPKILINEKFNKNEENLVDFTLAFSNVQKHYKMEKPKFDPCKEKQIDLVVLVISRRELLQRRMGIRNSWAKDASKKMIIRFVIGDAAEGEENSKKLDKILNEEQEQFGDLIRYHNIMEGYHFLQFKTGVALQWQQKWCPNAEYVMKIDDDSIIDLPRWEFWTENRFKKQLKATKNGLSFFGFTIEEVPPVREKDHKWYVSEKEYPNKLYPIYMHGSGYFANSKAITSLMKHAQEVYAIHIEDALYTGILAEKGNVSRIDHAFSHFRDDDLEKNEKCELGKPLIFCIYQKTLSSSTEYKEEYKKLHDLKCKK